MQANNDDLRPLITSTLRISNDPIGGMAGAVALAQAGVAPCVSLYVNNFNIAARASYSRVGFDTVGTFATVLF